MIMEQQCIYIYQYIFRYITTFSPHSYHVRNVDFVCRQIHITQCSSGMVSNCVELCQEEQTIGSDPRHARRLAGANTRSRRRNSRSKHRSRRRNGKSNPGAGGGTAGARVGGTSGAGGVTTGAQLKATPDYFLSGLQLFCLTCLTLLF